MVKISESTKFILKGFIPYTKANIALTYKPNQFFSQLEKISNLKERTLRSAYYRALKKGLIEMDDNKVPRLTPKGKRAVKKYSPSRLGKGASLLVTFDIPENQRHKRDHLRKLLHELDFKMIQQSVWSTEYDYRDYLAAEITEYGLGDSVIVYEASKLNI